ncbi:MAG: hypothetical protein MJZ64_08630 [Paludibacteraceae bacterium]|nr:hypothetical protein [Paludibacteraceae bacterium]
MQLRIGEVALYLRGLQIHRSDAGYVLMEYIDYMELTEKVENPDKSLKSWVQQYNINSLKRAQLKQDIVYFVFTHRDLYHVDKTLNTLFGKGNWTRPQCFTE